MYFFQYWKTLEHRNLVLFYIDPPLLFYTHINSLRADSHMKLKMPFPSFEEYCLSMLGDVSGAAGKMRGREMELPRVAGRGKKEGCFRSQGR